MGAKAGEDVVAVLPDGLGDDEGRVGGDVAEDFHAVLLAVDETVAFLFVEGVGAPDGKAFAFDGGDEAFFHGVLGGLAGLVGGGAEVAAGDEIDGAGRGLGGHGRLRLTKRSVHVERGGRRRRR